MPGNSTTCASAVWFLVGPFGGTDTARYLPIYTMPFVIGRRQDLALSLASKTISSLHAEITERGDALLLRDLGSTNGTYVNGQRISEPVALEHDDLVQFANMAYRVRRQVAQNSTHTVHEDSCDRAMALAQFDKLMAEHAVTPFVQPIVSMATQEIVSYEVLARSRLFGLEMPKDMFSVAAQLQLEVELSTMLRWEGIQACRAGGWAVHLFVNTHPRELVETRLLGSLETLRQNFPDQQLTLEIHESAVTGPDRMAELRAGLRELRIGLAYDDFGEGQSRLNELVQTPPDYLKFDMSLIRDIHAAPPQRQQVLATLVQMVRDLGITSVAEGIEQQAESDVCVQMGFDLAQGFLFGRPAPPGVRGQGSGLAASSAERVRKP
jgi:EAL domain-containing protein (putative c-di-GMP-specific phosphodiesterase class I)